MKQVPFNILSMLKESRNHFISGELLSKKLNLSRTAIWKHIHSLQKLGYIIEAVPNRGYRLTAEPDLLISREIKCSLNTQFMGNEILIFSSLDSTNRHAHRLAESNYPEGTIVLAEEQTKGRGRKSKSWFSPPQKGLWLSAILYPSAITPSKMAPLTAVSAVTTARGLSESTGEAVMVKWPNDLLLNERKIGGILAESKVEMEEIHYIILGIGINVNQTRDDFPEDLKLIASSLNIETNKKFNRNILCSAILKELEKGYLLFLQEGFTPFIEPWKKISHTLGKQVSIHYGENHVHGIAQDIDKEGALIIEDENNIKQRFNFGEIEYLQTN